MNASWNSSLSKNHILSCDEYRHWIIWKEGVDIALMSSYGFDSHGHFRCQRQQKHWRWHILTRPIVPISIVGVTPSWPLANPPKHPTPGLPGPPWSVSDQVQSPVVLSTKMALETTLFNQTNNQTPPFNLPFHAGFDSSVWRTTLLSEKRGDATIQVSTFHVGRPLGNKNLWNNRMAFNSFHPFFWFNHKKAILFSNYFNPQAFEKPPGVWLKTPRFNQKAPQINC